MKHLALTLFLFITFASSAQIQKRQVILSGQFATQYVQYRRFQSKNTQRNLTAIVDANIFLRDGLAVGLRVNGSRNTYRLKLEETPEYVDRNKYVGGGITPFVRKYWKLSPFFVYAGGGAKMDFSKTRRESRPVNTVLEDRNLRDFNIETQAQLGLIYPISSRLGLEFGAESALFPLAFNTLHLGLVVFSGRNTDISKKPLTDSPLSKGRWLLSGSFRSYYNKSTNTLPASTEKISSQGTYLELAPGIFLRDRLMVGLGVFSGLDDGVFNSINAGVTGNGKTPFMIGIRPFVKKYWATTKLTPYLEGYGTFDRIISDGPPTYTCSVGANIGLAYVLGKNWLAEARLIGLSGGNSWIKESEPRISCFNLMLEGGLKPNFTISYVFR